MLNKHIYLDNASTTRVDDRVLLAMEPFHTKLYANPSSVYSFGLEAGDAIEKSRAGVAKFFNAKPSEVVFTSGGTEGNNLAIFGSLAKMKKGRIITTTIEHPSVLKPIEALEKRGFEVIRVKPKSNGVVSVKDIEKYLDKETVLVSVMYANNEIGTIQPIAKIGKVISNFRNSKHKARNLKQNSKLKIQNSKLYEKSFPIFHTDACQATQYLDMDVQKLGVDMLTINGSKIHAPKGVGALYVRDGVELDAQILGGQQERGLRGGTENVPSVVALATALRIIKKSDIDKTQIIRDYLIANLLKISNSQLNGCKTRRLPNNVNISFSGVEGESLVLRLDKANIYTSTGSACSSQSLRPSHVVESIKGSEVAHSSLRISLSKYNTLSEAKTVVKEIARAVKELREIS